MNFWIIQKNEKEKKFWLNLSGSAFLRAFVT